MSYMFNDCINLNRLDLSFFNIDKINKIEGIFHGLSKEIIDSNISKFNKFNIDDMKKEYKGE